MSGSAEIQREISPRMTAESSTTITRNGCPRVKLGVEELANATLIGHQMQLKRHTQTLRRWPPSHRIADNTN
jgi:hypothetical protein